MEIQIQYLNVTTEKGGYIIHGEHGRQLSECKKLKLSRYAMKAPRGEYSSYSFLASELDAGEWSGSRSGRALLPGKVTRYPFDRRLGGRKSWSGYRGQRKTHLPLPGIEPRSSSQ
jgi:hypothetical protein